MKNEEKRGRSCSDTAMIFELLTIVYDVDKGHLVYYELLDNRRLATCMPGFGWQRVVCPHLQS